MTGRTGTDCEGLWLTVRALFYARLHTRKFTLASTFVYLNKLYKSLEESYGTHEFYICFFSPNLLVTIDGSIQSLLIGAERLAGKSIKGYLAGKGIFYCVPTLSVLILNPKIVQSANLQVSW